MSRMESAALAGLAAALLGAQAPAEAEPAPAFSIVELRQYTLRPGQRDILIALFDREFVETQEATGMKVIGQFRDLDNPDRFVWLRGFSDMESRAAGLAAFYSGPAWQAHREAANATMVDSDNVLLLRAPEPAAAFGPQPERPAAGAGAPAPNRIIVATIYTLRGDPAQAARFFVDAMVPLLDDAGIPVLAWLVTEPSPNNFPALPVRENERVLVWFSRFDGVAEHRHLSEVMAASPQWAEIAPRLDALLVRPPEVLRLAPTARSEMR